MTGLPTVPMPARILSMAGPKHSMLITDVRTQTAVPFPSPTARAGGRATGPPRAAPWVPRHRPGPRFPHRASN